MAKRNIGQEILESIRSIRQGEGKSYTVNVPPDAKTIRERMNLEHSAFASLLGVSLRTVKYWEQGKCKPCGAAQSLLLIAAKYPEVLKDITNNSYQKVYEKKISI